jgi:hypothetical protein
MNGDRSRLCEVIGAWLVCLAVAAAAFSTLDAAGPAGPDRAAAADDPGPSAVATARPEHGQRRC